MKLALLLACPLFLAPSATAQHLSVVEASRSVAVWAYGYDYDFDDGLALADSTRALGGAWQRSLLGDLDDWYDYDVADALAEQDSLLASGRLEFQLDGTSTTAGNHFQEDATARSEFLARFDVAQKVRYRFAAQVDSSYGYNEAKAELAGGGGSLFAVDGSYGTAQSTAQSGWLDAGQYLLTGSAEALAYGGSGTPDGQTAHAGASLELFDAADYQLDGDVDATDYALYYADWQTGDAQADMDGDGAVGPADLVEFEEAWKSAVNA